MKTVLYGWVNEKMDPVHPASFVVDDVQYPASVFARWSDAELAAVGVFRVELNMDGVGEDDVVDGYEYARDGDIVVATPILSKREPVVLPITKAQGKIALIQNGMWQAVLDWVDTLDDTERVIAHVFLNDTTEWRRENAFVVRAGEALGLTPGQIDELFSAARQIQF